jgi:oxalate decarboxylase/phosphoglucose isomerase-like protein (cupin superfamily)
MASSAKQIDPDGIPTHAFDWGTIKWFVTPRATPGAKLTFGEVVVMPGGGHGRHNHPDAEEILYVVSGEGEQMLDDGEPFPIKAGDVIYVPVGVYHSTRNIGWKPMRVLALYNPGGPEEALAELPDHEEIPPGATASWIRG